MREASFPSTIAACRDEAAQIDRQSEATNYTP